MCVGGGGGMGEGGEGEGEVIQSVLRMWTRMCQKKEVLLGYIASLVHACLFLLILVLDFVF